MGLSTERKIFIGLVGIAGIAFVVDRGLLGPGEAAASSISQEAGAAPAAVSATQAVGISKPAAAILIDRLKSKVLASAQGSDDTQLSLGSSFSLASLIETVPPDTGLSDNGASNPDPSSLMPSLPVLRPSAPDLPKLSSVMPASNGGGAVLGGKLLMVGQVGPNGYKLLQVKARGVQLEKDGRRYTIEIPVIGG